MTQRTAIEAIKKMPEDFSIDELYERLDFIEKVEQGLKDIEEGRTIPLEEVKKIVEGWRK